MNVGKTVFYSILNFAKRCSFYQKIISLMATSLVVLESVIKPTYPYQFAFVAVTFIKLPCRNNDYGNDYSLCVLVFIIVHV